MPPNNRNAIISPDEKRRSPAQRLQQASDFAECCNAA